MVRGGGVATGPLSDSTDQGHAGLDPNMVLLEWGSVNEALVERHKG